MIRQVHAEIFPFERTSDLSQEPYRKAFHALAKRHGAVYTESVAPVAAFAMRRLRTVRDSYKLERFMGQFSRGGLNALARIIGGVHSLTSEPRAGRFRVQLDSGKTLTIVVDTNDSGDLILADYDLYLKSNYWPSRIYPKGVLPTPNLNPAVMRHVARFQRMRSTPKSYDLFAFVRVWGGKDELEGIEHNIALLEGLAKVPVRKYVGAYLVAGDIPALAKRLTAAGIRWTDKPMPQPQLWRLAAASRLNIVRLGMHECVPWRMTDILAMGGCPVVDYGPQTRWPEPLIKNKHFLSLEFGLGCNEAGIADRIAAWLEIDIAEQISCNTAQYFDDCLTPVPLSRLLNQYIVEYLL